MRGFISIVFLIVFGVTISSKSIYLVYWKFNQDSIIQKYCENKDKPVLKCNGKCHLMKQMTKIEQSESSKKANEDNSKKTDSKIIEFPMMVNGFIFHLTDDYVVYKGLTKFDDNSIKLIAGVSSKIYSPPKFF